MEFEDRKSPFFSPNGAHVLVDGQYGSTGKGAFAAHLARECVRQNMAQFFRGAVTSAGPNSGHTSFFNDESIVLKQLPTFGVHMFMRGKTIPCYLSAGAIIDPAVLNDEARRYPKIPIYVSPNAAVIDALDKEAEGDGSTIEAVASTQSGTGAALARKIMRDPYAVIGNVFDKCGFPDNVKLMGWGQRIDCSTWAYFYEVAQGFSLGINGKFYPHATSRECTVAQALADAQIPPADLRKTYMVIRTYPIRVGNLGIHSSGGWYPDQEEITWDSLGVAPELTTVTKRIRRVATFSLEQFYDALAVNRPDWVAVNFMNYLRDELQHHEFKDMLYAARKSTGYRFRFAWGFGPDVDDWQMD